MTPTSSVPETMTTDLTLLGVELVNIAGGARWIGYHEAKLSGADRKTTKEAIAHAGVLDRAAYELARLTAHVAALEARCAEMEAALHPFGEYATCRDAQPLRGLDDVIHAIHVGTPWESELRLSDCRRAAKLLGYDASLLASRAARSASTPNQEQP